MVRKNYETIFFFRFYTKYVSEIESDSVGDFTRCRESLKDLGMTDVSDADCSALRYVCECVSRRAGFMVSLCYLNICPQDYFSIN